jgi:hypothetical protein
VSVAWADGWASGFGGTPPTTQGPGTDRIGKAIHDVIAAAMGMDPKAVRPAGQNAPTGRVDKEFAIYQITSAEDAGFPEAEATPQAFGTATEAAFVPQYLTVSVNFYRGKSPSADAAGLPVFTTGAYDRAKRLPLRLRLTPFAELLRSYGLGFIGASEPRNLSGFADAHHESRGQVDLQFSIIALETSDVATFESFGGAVLTVEDQAGVPTTKTIT